MSVPRIKRKKNKHPNATPTTTPQTDSNIPRHEPGHATGPITPDGKARVALNAFKHGLTATPSATMHFLPYENPDDHERLRLAFNEQFVPMTPAEHALIREIVDSLWLARRARDLQSFELADLNPDRQILSLYLRYETAHTRAHQAAIKTLLALQKDRRERNQNHETWNEPVVWGLADSVIFETANHITGTEAEAMEAITPLSVVRDSLFRNPNSAPTGKHVNPAAATPKTAANLTQEELKPAA